MPSIINSDDGVVSGTSGLKTTGGNDGLLNIQSNGSTIVAVTGSGISVTGTVSQTGVSTFAAGTASAPSITFTGDTNTGIFSSGADTVNITTGGSERMRIDSSGNVVIGTTTSNGRLTVSGSSSGAYIAQTLENTNSGGYAQQLFRIGSAGGSGEANINYAPGIFFALGPTANDTTTPIVFLNNNGTERARIPAAGGFQCVNSISVGNATPTTSGAGITFPATQSASSNANTLDDYEEGTWTPSIGGTATYTIQKGTYTKVGRLVTCHFRIIINARGTGSTTLLSGLPFSSSNDSYGDIFSGPCSYFASLGANTYCLSLYLPSNSTTIYFVGQDGLDGTCVNEPAVFANSADIAGSITYFSA